MRSIDERVVQMQFENSQFERHARESLKTIEELKKSLKFEDAQDSLEQLQRIGNSFSLSHIANSVDTVSERFSALGIIGKRIFENLADSAYRFGEKFVKSVTIDQITSGWDKYAKDTSAVQTIMFATGRSIREVETELEKLTWFTDETSYSYSDMVDNIGKFTSMRIPLEDARIAMQGIALAAAAAGQNAQAASRAMYNVSQALGAGSMKVTDWMSIENANMATADLKENAIKAAIALGTLNKEGQLVTEVGTGKKKRKKVVQVTVENFRETLKEGWFSKDVIMKVFGDYGEFAEKVQELVAETGMSTSDAMAQLSGSTSLFSENAFRAGQEAKTFAEAIDAVKDAASTSWLRIFKGIFGNYEEAKKIWTKLANDLYDIFVEPLSGIIDVLNEWHSVEDGLGSWNDFMQGLSDVMDGLKGIAQTVTEAFKNLIPETTVEDLQKLSLAVRDFGANFKAMFGIEDAEEELDGVAVAADKAAKAVDNVGLNIQNRFGKNLGIGDRGEEVRQLQTALVQLDDSLDIDFIDGIFGKRTEEAVKDFQKLKGLNVTGKLDKDTFVAITRATADATNSLKSFDEQLIKDGWTVDKYFTALENYLGSIGIGAKGKEVVKLQKALIQLGYLDEKTADGIFGPKTEAALMKFQEASGLVTDGLYNRSVFEALEKAGIELGDYYFQSIARGMKSEKVKKMQEELLALGFELPRFGADGIFGSETEAALREFQKQYGLTVDGIFDEEDAKKLAELQYERAEASKKSAEESAEATEKATIQTKEYASQLEKVKSISGGIFAFGGIMLKIAGAIGKVIGTVWKITAPIRNALIEVAAAVGNVLIKFNQWLGESGYLEEKVIAIENALKPVGDIIQKVADAFLVFFGLKTPAEGMTEEVITFAKVWDSFKDSLEKSGFLQNVSGAIENVRKSFENIRPSIEKVFGTIGENGGGIFNTILKALSTLVSVIAGSIGVVIGSIGKLASFIIDRLPNVIEILKNFWASLTFEGDAELGKAPGILAKAKRVYSDIVEFLFGSIEKGKTGIFSRIGKLLSGDIKGFAEGLQANVVDKLTKVVNLFKRIKAIIGLLFTGKSSDFWMLDFDTIQNIVAFRASISKVFAAIKDVFLKIAGFVSTLFSGKDIGGLLSNDLVKKINKIRKTIKDVFGNIGSTLIYAWKRIKDVFDGGFDPVKAKNLLKDSWDKIKEFFSNLWKTIRGFFTGDEIKGFAASSWDKGTGFLVSVWNRLSGFVSGIWSGITDYFKSGKITASLETAGKNLKAFFSHMWDSLVKFFASDEFKNGVANVWKAIKSFFAGAWAKLSAYLQSGELQRAINKIWTGLGDTLKAIWDGASTTLKWAIAIYILYKVVRIIDNATDAFQSIKNALLGTKSKASKLTTALLKFAGSVLMIVGAIAAMTLLSKDPEAFASGLLSVVGLILLVAGLIGTIGKTISKKNAENISKIGSAIKNMALGIGVLVGAVWLIGKALTKTNEDGDLVGLKQMAAGFIGVLVMIAGVFAVIYGMQKLFKTSGVKMDLSGPVWQLAILIGVLGIVAHSLGKMDLADLAKGVGAAGLIVLALSVLMRQAAKAPNGKLKLKGFLSLAVLIGVLGTVAKKIGKMKPEKYTRAMGAIALIMGSIIGLTAVLGHFSDKFDWKSILTLFGGLAAVIGVFGYVLTKIKNVDPLVMVSFAGSLAIALGAFVAACAIIGKTKQGPTNMMKGAAGIGGSIGVLAVILGGIAAGLGELDKITGGGLIEIIKRGGAVLEAIADAMTPFQSKFENAIVIVGLLVASEIVGQLKDGGKAMINGALAISGALIILAAVVTLITWGLGGIDKLSEGKFLDTIKRGGEVLTAIAGAFGVFENNFKTSLALLAGYLVASEILGLIPGGPVALLLGGLALSGSLIVLVSALTVITGGLGYLDQVWGGQLKSNIETGGEVLTAIAGAFGVFENNFKTSLALLAGYLVASEILGLIPGGPVALLLGGLALSGSLIVLVSALTVITGGLGALEQAWNGGLSAAITAGGTVLNAIGAAIANFVSGFVDVFITDINDFAAALANVRDSVNGLGGNEQIDSDIQKALDVAGTLKDFFDSISDYGIDATGLQQYNKTASSVLSKDIGTFGENIAKFHNGVKGLDADKTFDADTDKAIAIAEKIKTGFFDEIAKEGYLPDGDGLVAYNTKVSSLLTHIGTFGINIGAFRAGVTGYGEEVKDEDVNGAIAAAQKIADFCQKVSGMDIETKASGIAGWFQGETKSDTVISDVAKLGEAIKNSRTTFSGLSDSSVVDGIASAVTAMKGIASLLVYLGEEDVKRAVELGSSGFQGLRNLLEVGLGPVIEDFADSLKDVDNLPDIGKIFEGFAAMATYLSTDNSVQLSFSETGASYAKAVLKGFGEYDISSEGGDAVGIHAFIDKIITAIASYEDRYIIAGENLILGIITGINNQSASAITSVGTLAQSMLDKFSEVIDSHSPSLEMVQRGVWFVQGLVQGVDKTAGEATNAVDGLGQALLDTFSNVIQGNEVDIAGILSNVLPETDVNGFVKKIIGDANVEDTLNGLYNNITNGFGSLLGNNEGAFDFSSLFSYGDNGSDSLFSDYMKQWESLKTEIYASGGIEGILSSENGTEKIESLFNGYSDLFKDAFSDLSIDRAFTGELKYGSRGEAIKNMQKMLMDLGYNLDKYGADGIFGPETQAALNKFKKEYGLVTDGIFDEKTYEKLTKAYTSSDATKAYSDTGDSISDSIEKGINDSSVNTRTFVNSITASLNGYREDFKSVGENFVRGISSGIYLNTYLAVEAAKYAAERMLEAIKQTFQIQSPSKVTTEFGRYFTEGLANGTSENADLATDSVGDVANGMLDAAQKTLATVYSLLDENIDAEPVISPVVDLTNVRSAAGSIADIFGQKHETGLSVTRGLAYKANPVSSTQTVNPGTIDTTNKELASTITKLNERIDVLGQDLQSMKVYIDGSILTGYVSPKVDRSLGKSTILAGRMN